MHPELVYQAANKAHVPVLTLLYDAHCFFEKPVSRRSLWNMYCEFAHNNIVPQFIEDYSIKVLAGHCERLDGVAIVHSTSRRR